MAPVLLFRVLLPSRLSRLNVYIQVLFGAKVIPELFESRIGRSHAANGAELLFLPKAEHTAPLSSLLRDSFTRARRQ